MQVSLPIFMAQFCCPAYTKDKRMKIVNSKSKNKTHKPGTWYRIRFSFPSHEDCNETALNVATLLRGVFPHVYFARYSSAVESNLDVIVNAVSRTMLSQKELDRIIREGKCRWTRVEGPEPCEGSRAHAAMFDFVLGFTGLARVLNLDPHDQRALWSDVIHWGHNMAGYDYVDESRCYLHGLDKIMDVFARSIKLGNEMTAVQKRLSRRQRKPNLN